MTPSPTPAPAGTGTATDAELIDAASDANIAYGGAADGSAEGSVACDNAVQAEEAILARLASLRSESEWRRDQIAALALKLSDAESSVATLTRQLAEAQQDTALLEKCRVALRSIGPVYYHVDVAASRAKKGGKEEAADALEHVYGRLYWMDFALGTMQERIDAEDAERRAVPTTPDREG